MSVPTEFRPATRMDTDLNRRRLKVLYTSEVALPAQSGPGINELEFLSGLWACERTETWALVPDISEAAHELEREERVTRTWSHRGYHPVHYLLHLVDTVRKGVRLVGAESIDIVVARPGRVPIAQRLISVLADVPLALKTIAGLLVFSEHTPFRRKLLWPVLLPIHRALAGQASVLDTPSETYKRWVEHRYRVRGGRVRVVPNSTNTKTFHPGSQSAIPKGAGRTRLGYVGSLNRWRNLPFLVDSFARSDLGDVAECSVVGDGPAMAGLRARVKQRGVGNRVSLEGRIPYRDVPRTIRGFDLALDFTIKPMQVGKDRLYGSFSQKQTQYLACGVPVVACDVSDNRYIEENDLGYLVDVGDATALERVVERHRGKTPEEKQRMAERCREFAVRHLSVDATTRQRVALWMEAVAGHTGSGDDQASPPRL